MSEEDTTSSSPVPVQPHEKIAILVPKSRNLEELFLSSLVHQSLQQTVSATHKTYLSQICPRLFVIFTALSLVRDTLIRAYPEDGDASLLVSLLSLCHPTSK